MNGRGRTGPRQTLSDLIGAALGFGLEILIVVSLIAVAFVFAVAALAVF